MGRRRLCAFLSLCLFLGAAAPACEAGKLDLDIYSSQPPPSAQSRPERRLGAGEQWRPGDPRDLEGERPWVHYVSHAGFAALGAAGLVTCVATGGVAPAVGFGLVALIQAWSGWKFYKSRS